MTSPPDVPLQILAGPGSGKTRVLTSRVAHLVRRHDLSPRQITAVTFTNKAANEMRKRLQVLLGPDEAAQLVLGKSCLWRREAHGRYIPRYMCEVSPTAWGAYWPRQQLRHCRRRRLVSADFVRSTANSSKKILARLLKERKDELVASRISLKEGAVLSEISKAKAKGESPESMAIRAAQDAHPETSPLGIIAELYAEYELSLREAKSLDFDDLLVFGLRLFRQEPDILESCHHILVDEFQVI